MVKKPTFSRFAYCVLFVPALGLMAGCASQNTSHSNFAERHPPALNPRVGPNTMAQEQLVEAPAPVAPMVHEMSISRHTPQENEQFFASASPASQSAPVAPVISANLSPVAVRPPAGPAMPAAVPADSATPAKIASGELKPFVIGRAAPSATDENFVPAPVVQGNADLQASKTPSAMMPSVTRLPVLPAVGANAQLEHVISSANSAPNPSLSAAMPRRASDMKASEVTARNATIAGAAMPASAVQATSSSDDAKSAAIWILK